MNIPTTFTVTLTQAQASTLSTALLHYTSCELSASIDDIVDAGKAIAVALWRRIDALNYSPEVGDVVEIVGGNFGGWQVVSVGPCDWESCTNGSQCFEVRPDPDTGDYSRRAVSPDDVTHVRRRA